MLCGSPVLSDKKNADILLTSPVSGTVRQIVRGEKRKLLAVLIEADGKRQCVDFALGDAAGLDADKIRQALLQSGLWPALIQRPYGVIADPDIRPRDIFISTFSSAPLAPDSDFCYSSELQAMQAGVDALAKLTDGRVWVGVDRADSPFASLQGVQAPGPFDPEGLIVPEKERFELLRRGFLRSPGCSGIPLIHRFSGMCVLYVLKNSIAF